jgi:dCMP deaminase
MQKNRKSFIDAAMDTAVSWSLRSEDSFKKVGCCILNKKGRVLSVGYNGLPSKFKPSRGFWSNRDLRRKFILHAEINALSLLKLNDEPYILVSTLLPCSSCATSIIAHGIKNVVYLEKYNLDQNALDIFKFYGINLSKYENKSY